MVYLPLSVVQDTNFPFRPEEKKLDVKVTFSVGERKLLIEEWDDEV